MSDKVFQSRKIVSVCESQLDSAVDYEAMDIPAYAKSFDEALVIVKEGKTPTWINVQGMKRMEFVRMMDSLNGELTKKTYAFSVGCTSIVKPNGTILMPDKGEKDWQDRWFETVCDEFGMDYPVAIGSVVMALSKLPKA